VTILSEFLHWAIVKFATEDTGAMDREIESRQGIVGSFLYT
jgi:hypothetical protein